MNNISDISSVVSAGAAVATVLGGAITFVWGRVEYTNRKTKQALKRCEDRDVKSRIRREKTTTIIELRWQEVQRLAPSSPVLLRVQRLLDALKHDDDVDQPHVGD